MDRWIDGNKPIHIYCLRRALPTWWPHPTERQKLGTLRQILEGGLCHFPRRVGLLIGHSSLCQKVGFCENISGSTSRRRTRFASPSCARPSGQDLASWKYFSYTHFARGGKSWLSAHIKRTASRRTSCWKWTDLKEGTTDKTTARRTISPGVF